MLRNSLTGKQKSFLRSLGQKLEPVVMMGKEGVTPTVVEAAREAIKKRELIKVRVLQNCMDDPKEMAQMLAERTRSELVQVIGRKFVLYKEGKDDKKKIILPPASKKTSG